MLDRIFGKKTHELLYVIGLAGVACGLAWSKVMISISLMLLGLNFLLEGDFRNKLNRAKSTKLFIAIALFYGIHLIGLIYTSNFEYGFHDITTKLPLIVLPFILAAKPITNRHHIDLILAIFVGTLLITSLWNYAAYQSWVGNYTYNDIRGMSLFGSHIRYGLLISFSIGILGYFIHQYRKYWLILTVSIAWFIYYTFYSQVIAGLLAFISLLFLVGVFLSWRWKKWVALSFSTISIGIAILFLFWLFKPLKTNPAIYENLPQKTAKGNPYTHHGGFISSETGEPILLYLCEKELREEWNKRSKIDYDGRDIKGNKLKHTLTRYLSSMRLHKDAEGMAHLTDKDIKNIEHGIPSKHHKGIIARLHSTRFEINNSSNPNGHSLLQRIEYWKAGLNIIKNNWIFGVGTGDIQDEFNRYYEQTNSVLTPKNRNRTHNQFLTVWITFGIVGFAAFNWLLFVFTQFCWKNEQLLGIMFIAVATSSFLTEDTLETQVGVTFFAFFYALFQNRLTHKDNVTNKVA